MQCDEARDVLFEYSEGKLQELERQAVDQHLHQCDDCSALLQEIWEMALAATSWEARSVPRWDRRGAFFGERTAMLPWLNLVSVAASVIVLIAVIFQVEIQSTEEGFSLAVAGSHDTITREELDRRFDARDRQLDQVLASNAERLTAQQVATSQLLLRTLLQMSREERKEDLMEVMTVWDGDRKRIEDLTRESFGYLISTQLAGQRELEELSNAVRSLDIREDNQL